MAVLYAPADWKVRSPVKPFVYTSVFIRMKIITLSLLCVGLALTPLPAQTPSGIAGRWRAIVLMPNGATQDISMTFEAEGDAVKGTALGLPITGRLEGETVTLSMAIPGRPVQDAAFTGQKSGDEILFRAVGIIPVPIQFVARRDTRFSAAGSVTDQAAVDGLLKRFNVPGVSIAVIKDFKVVFARGYGVADVETGAPVTTETMFQAASISKPVAAMVSLKAVQDRRFGLDQDVNTILKSWKLPDGSGKNGSLAVTPRMLMSHTSGTGDAFGFPGYDPGTPLPTLPQILDGHKPSNLRAVRLERPPMTGFEYSGGAVIIQQLAVTDAAGKPFAQLARETVLGPLGMTDSTFDQPLAPGQAARAARAHNRTGARGGAPYHVYPEQAAAGLWTTPTDLAKFAIEVQLATQGRSERVLSPAMAREMVTPVGLGPFAVGFEISKQGEGWYFAHGGSNWGFQCDLTAHRFKGYGAVIMTNGDNGGALIGELRRMIQQEYKWDVLDEPIPRRYGPTR
jgi:CubicO group peptidase (beta-lactamase class C family)